MQAGSTQQFTATGTYSDNSTKDITSQVTWSSSNTAVASINAAGLATAPAAGTTTISAVQGGITGTTTLTVQAPPSVSTATLPNGTVGVPYSATLTATGGTAPYTWAITSGALPAGLSLNTATGSITGTPTVAGVSTFTVQVTDSFVPAGTAVRNLSITIAQPSADTGFLPPTANAPVKVGAGDNNGFETTPTNAYRSDGLFAVDTNSGNTTSTSCTNTGKDKHDFFAYSFGLPNSAVIQGIEVRLDARVNSTANSPMMCVQLSWDGGATWTAPQTTPTLSTTTATYLVGGAANSWGRSWSGADFSNTNFRVRVIDVAAAITSTFSLDFLAVRITYQGSGPTLNAIAVTPANSTVAAGSVQQFTATGTYSDGSTVDITNNVTWTSSTATVATVNFSGSVTGVAVGNANISAAQGGIQGTTAVAVFGVSTTSLPTATVGTAYSATLAAVNGTTPYTWAMVSGALPSGLTLNPSGTVTGTPSVNGNFSFTVRVTDSGAPPLQATKTLSMMAVTNTGFLQPNADAPVTTGAGNNNGFETNPANAYVLDGLFAVDADSGTTTSALYTDTGKDRHDFFGYSFGLPSNALIRGIEVRLDAKADSTLNTPRIYVQLSWNGGTSWTAAQATPTLTTTTATYIVGGIVNVWGRTWVASDFSNTNFRVRVINVAGSTARTFSLDWLAVRVSYQESGPTITSIAVTPVNLTAQAGATQQFTATGTYSDNSTKDITSQVTWSSSSTAVASINAVGLATTVGAGTITISALQGGTTGTTTLTVQAPPSVSTATLPNGMVGVPYSATLSATGGISPYSWSITSGALPVGLSLDATSGSISGTPSVAGVSTFTIQATDSSNPAATAVKDLSISILSPSTATGFLPPTANAPVKVGAGDNNGFETTPTNAYRSDGLFAVDTNSGTTTSTSCTNTGKDKHDFFAYSFGLPSTAVIQGIEVRLDARVNSAANSPMMCVQLSWDGGATWTAPQTTPTLSTTTATYLVGGAANSWGGAGLARTFQTRISGCG